MKKHFVKTAYYLICLVIVSTLITGCSTTGSRMYAYDVGGSPSYESGLQTLQANKQRGPNVMVIEKKMIYRASLSLIVENPDSTNVYIEKVAEKYKGYVNKIGTDQTIIRVKSGNLDAAVIDISELGKVERKTKTGEDVTEDYLDFKIRLENAEMARKRYLELLKKAENVETALKVEKELERLNETLDLIKGKMNRINNLAEYSTIVINLKEKKKPGIIGYIGIGLYHSVKWLFVRN